MSYMGGCSPWTPAFGRPTLAKALAGLIGRVTERGRMWVASMGEIAGRTRAAAASPSIYGRS
jgi:hypothetical protein